jgi:hypothetical protein
MKLHGFLGSVWNFEEVCHGFDVLLSLGVKRLELLESLALHPDMT